jgi:O-antigen/teichoic acid export membrane protein
LGKNQIRLRYSGFVVFATQLLGVITGLIFTLLLTRTMTVSQFGIWANIFDYTPYFIIVSGVLPFWATRFTARNIDGTAKTAALSQLSIAVVSTIIYLPIIFLISIAIGTSSYMLIYFIAGLYILTYYIVAVFEAILQATKPQVTGYGFIIQEIVKVTVALVIILVFKQIFLGAIFALVLAPTVQILYYCYLLSDYFKQKTDWSFLKQWLKGSPAIAFNAVGAQLLSFVFILLFIFGGPESRAYYQAALSFTTIVGYSSSLSVALYPKLLANCCSEEEVSLSFRTVLMLAIPLATITITLASSFLTILNASYGIAWPVLVALTVDTLIVLLNTFFSSCLMGLETFDAKGQISLRELVKSKIFRVFSIPYIQAAVALPLTYFVLICLPMAGSVQATVSVVIILIGVHTATFFGLYTFLKQTIHIPFAWKNITKYLLCALIMGLVLFFSPTTTKLLSTITKAILGFSLYTGVLLAIDAQARGLVRLIWKEINVTLRQLTHRTVDIVDSSEEDNSTLSEN